MKDQLSIIIFLLSVICFFQFWSFLNNAVKVEASSATRVDIVAVMGRTINDGRIPTK